MKLSNLIHIALMLAAMTALLAMVGYILAGVRGMMIVAGISLAFMVMGRGASKGWMLKAVGAVRLAPDDAPGLFAILHELATRANLEQVPDLYVMDSELMLGFSAGGSEDDASIVLSGPLLQGLSAREVAGVLAHEIAHIHAGDLTVMGIADLLTRLTRTLSLLGLVLVIFNVPLAATVMGGGQLPWSALLLLVATPMVNFMIQMALSRAREFDADANALELCGDPLSLAQALEKLETQQSGALRSMFIPPKPGSVPSLLRSHPVTDERVRRIMAHPLRHPPLSNALVGEHHGFPDQWSVDFTLPIRWLMRWWR